MRFTSSYSTPRSIAMCTLVLLSLALAMLLLVASPLLSEAKSPHKPSTKGLGKAMKKVGRELKKGAIKAGHVAEGMAKEYTEKQLGVPKSVVDKVAKGVESAVNQKKGGGGHASRLLVENREDADDGEYDYEFDVEEVNNAGDLSRLEEEDGGDVDVDVDDEDDEVEAAGGSSSRLGEEDGEDGGNGDGDDDGEAEEAGAGESKLATLDPRRQHHPRDGKNATGLHHLHRQHQQRNHHNNSTKVGGLRGRLGHLRDAVRARVPGQLRDRLPFQRGEHVKRQEQRQNKKL